MTTDFLLEPGTNGFIGSSPPITLLSTELNALTSGGAVTSTVGGTAGVFTQTNTGSAPQGGIWYKNTLATPLYTPAAGAYLAGWFLLSGDGGTTFETPVTSPSTTVPALARAPDFIIPMANQALVLNAAFWCQGRFVGLPWESFKVLLQNMSGATMSATLNAIVLGPTALHYN